MKIAIPVTTILVLTTSAAFAQAPAAAVDPAAPAASASTGNVYNTVPNTLTEHKSDASTKLLQQGVDDFKAGKLSDAAVELQAVEKQDPGNVVPHNLLGYIYLKQNKPDAALSEMQTVVQLAPNNVGAQKNLAQAYFQTGQYDKAAATYNAVLAANPTDSSAQYGLALTLGQQGNYDQSAAAFRKSIAEKPTADAYRNLGVVLQKSGKRAEAADAFQQAATLNPTDETSALNAGFLYADTGADSKAIPALNQAISLGVDPAYKYQAHMALGQSYAKTGDNAKAITEFTTASQLKPDDPTAFFELGVLEQQGGQTSQAEQAYEQVLSLKPADQHMTSQTESYLGVLLSNDGNVDQSIPLLTSAVQADPNSAPLHVALGNVYAKQGQKQQAMEERAKAVELNPSDNQTRLLLGDSYMSAKRYADAAEQYQAVEKTDPSNSAVRNALGVAYEDMGETSIAFANFKAASVGNGTDKEKAMAENDLGVAYEKQGKKSFAIAAYRKAIKLDPTLAEARKNLARFSAK